MPAVEVGIGVEQMRFEARLRGADGRAQTDIGDPVDGAAAERIVGAVAANPDGIDAKGRTQIFAEPEIGGREADCPPPAVAHHDPPVDLPKAAELGRRLARPAAVPRPHLAQQFGRAATAIAERAVMADDDMAEPDRPEHDLLDKVFGAPVGEFQIEMLDEQELDPEPCDLALLDPERGQAKRLALRHKDTARMRLEGQDARRRSGTLGARAGRLDQRGMPQMQPVEITHRQYRAARMGRSGTGMSDNAEHGAVNSLSSQRSAAKI